MHTRKVITLSIVSLLLAVCFVGLAQAQLPDDSGVAQINFGTMNPGSSQTFTIQVNFAGSSFTLTGIESQEIGNFITTPNFPIYIAGENGNGNVTLNLQIPTNATDYEYNGTIRFIGLDTFNQNVATSIPFTLTVNQHPQMTQATLNKTLLVFAGAVACAAFMVAALMTRRR